MAQILETLEDGSTIRRLASGGVVAVSPWGRNVGFLRHYDEEKALKATIDAFEAVFLGILEKNEKAI